MSKRDLKKYLESLNKEQIAEQFLELYAKFPEVKTYYNFIFNPNEEKLLRDAKLKISAEYFPTKTKKAKLRRSTAQKIIKHFFMLGVEPHITAEVMLYNITVAQKYSAKKEMYYNSFYKSILNSFEQCVNYCISNGILPHFRSQLLAVSDEVAKQKWPNKEEFKNIVAIIRDE